MKEKISKRIEKLATWIAWHLPRQIVYWTIVRIFAVSSTGKFSNKEAGSITLFDAIEVWK
jgi:hypothetical protein